MNNTKQTNNNTENENSLSEERQDVTCSEERTELSPSSGSPKLSVSERLDILIKNAEITLQAAKDTNEYDGDNSADFFAERCKLLGRDDSVYQCL